MADKVIETTVLGNTVIEGNADGITPKQYFDYVKDKKNKTDNEELQNMYDNCLIILNKYIVTGQKKSAKYIVSRMEIIEKEMKILDMGLDIYVYREDIENYIDNIADDVVKIIELQNYPREVPDECIDIISKTKDIFDVMYVIFTDYTDGKLEKEVEKERDPILFGTFYIDNTPIDKFYFITDWVDNECDLTLEKMVSAYKKCSKKSMGYTLSKPKTLEELRVSLDSISKKDEKRSTPFKKLLDGIKAFKEKLK